MVSSSANMTSFDARKTILEKKISLNVSRLRVRPACIAGFLTRASDRRDQPGSRSDGSTARISRRSFLSIERVPHPDTPAARTRRGHPAPHRPLRPPVRRASGKRVEEVPDDVIATLKHYSWPGNVRELQNVIERAVVGHDRPDVAITRAGASHRPCGCDVAHARASRTGPHRSDLAGNKLGARRLGQGGSEAGAIQTTLISRMQRLGISAGSGLRKSASHPRVSRATKRTLAQPQVAG